MKLTKLQRHTAYIILFVQIESGEDEFMCIASRDVFDIEICDKCYLFNETFPELYRKKPVNAGHSWFNGSFRDGRKKRIEILKRCIEETY